MSDFVKDYLTVSIFYITFLLGLPSNILVFFIYIRKARKRGATPNVVYALNLCVANLVLVAWLPVKAFETLQKTWQLPPLVCPIFNFFLFSSVYGSCLFLTAVTVGRYLSIAFPIIYKMYRRARISCFISAALWAIVFIHLGIGFTAEGGDNFVSIKNNVAACYDTFNETQLDILLPLRFEMAVLLFIVPLIITSFCTLRCVMLVWRSNLRPLGKKRVLTVALSTLAVFIVCYAPYNTSHIVGFILDTNVEWRSLAILTCSCNVFLEPAVMLMLSPAVPIGFMRRLCRWQSHFSQSERSPRQYVIRNTVANFTSEKRKGSDTESKGRSEDKAKRTI